MTKNYDDSADPHFGYSGGGGPVANLSQAGVAASAGYFPLSDPRTALLPGDAVIGVDHAFGKDESAIAIVASRSTEDDDDLIEVGDLVETIADVNKTAVAGGRRFVVARFDERDQEQLRGSFRVAFHNYVLEPADVKLLARARHIDGNGAPRADATRWCLRSSGREYCIRDLQRTMSIRGPSLDHSIVMMPTNLGAPLFYRSLDTFYADFRPVDMSTAAIAEEDAHFAEYGKWHAAKQAQGEQTVARIAGLEYSIGGYELTPVHDNRAIGTFLEGGKKGDIVAIQMGPSAQTISTYEEAERLFGKGSNLNPFLRPGAPAEVHDQNARGWAVRHDWNTRNGTGDHNWVETAQFGETWKASFGASPMRMTKAEAEELSARSEDYAIVRHPDCSAPDHSPAKAPAPSSEWTFKASSPRLYGFPEVPQPRPGQSWRRSIQPEYQSKELRAIPTGALATIIDDDVTRGVRGMLLARVDGQRIWLSYGDVQCWFAFESGPTTPETPRAALERVIRLEAERVPEHSTPTEWLAFLVATAEVSQINEATVPAIRLVARDARANRSFMGSKFAKPIHRPRRHGEVQRWSPDDQFDLDAADCLEGIQTPDHPASQHRARRAFAADVARAREERGRFDGQCVEAGLDALKNGGRTL